MKVAVSSNGEDLNAQLDPRFGSCAYYFVVDPDDMSFEAFENKNAVQRGGAGINLNKFIRKVQDLSKAHFGGWLGRCRLS